MHIKALHLSASACDYDSKYRARCIKLLNSESDRFEWFYTRMRRKEDILEEFVNFNFDIKFVSNLRIK